MSSITRYAKMLYNVTTVNISKLHMPNHMGSFLDKVFLGAFLTDCFCYRRHKIWGAYFRNIDKHGKSGTLDWCVGSSMSQKQAVQFLFLLWEKWSVNSFKTFSSFIRLGTEGVWSMYGCTGERFFATGASSSAKNANCYHLVLQSLFFWQMCETL